MADDIAKNCVITVTKTQIVASEKTVTRVIANKTDAPRVIQGCKQGPPGVSGAAIRYEHDQQIASLVWTVPHNLHTYPTVTVIDTQLRLITADVEYVDEDIVQIIHSTPVAGRAFCM